MQENTKLITDGLQNKNGESSCSAVIREENANIDFDVDPHREPVLGDPERFNSLYHRGTV